MDRASSLQRRLARALGALLFSGAAAGVVLAATPVLAAAGSRAKPGATPEGEVAAPDRAADLARRELAAQAAFSLQGEANRDALTAQKKIEALDEETQQLLSRYRGVVTETASYDAYAKQLEQSIASQTTELEKIRDQMARANDTARDVLPLTARLVDDLDQFIALDVPFSLAERKQRIAGLRELMNRADVSLSEKYRRVIEAYLIELEYGRTMETYQGVLDTGGKPLTVDFLRIGRVALLYQTPDGKRTGYWDKDSKTWVESAEYERAFKKGARVASKQDAPDLVIAPVRAPGEM